MENTINDVNSLDTMLDNLGTEKNSETTESESTETTESESTETTETETTETEETETTETEDSETRTTPEQDKAARAFAAMRVENKQYKDAVLKMAKQLGLDPNASNLLESINDKVLEERSKETKIPKEVLAEMESLQQFRNQQMLLNGQARIKSGFEAIKSTYEADDARLREFAEQLDQMGINVIKNPNLDLVKEYRNMYFEEILEKKTQTAIEKALKKDAAAGANSTTPGRKKGKTSDVGDQITTVKALDAFLDSLKK